MYIMGCYLFISCRCDCVYKTLKSSTSSIVTLYYGKTPVVSSIMGMLRHFTAVICESATDSSLNEKCDFLPVFDNSERRALLQ
jgi:hypothetical protein